MQERGSRRVRVWPVLGPVTEEEDRELFAASTLVLHATDPAVGNRVLQRQIRDDQVREAIERIIARRGVA